jgi:hypothetical protein
MGIEHTLQKEIEESQRWLNIEKEDSTYKRDLAKRIELINWVLENMKNLGIPICDRIESKMSDLILSINQTHSIFDADKLHTELRILDWILYQVCGNEVKRIGLIDKEETSYDDSLDALRLSLKECNIK